MWAKIIKLLLQSDLDLLCLSKRLQKHFSRRLKQMIIVIGTLRVNKCKQCIYSNCQNFHEMHARLCGKTTFSLFIASR